MEEVLPISAGPAGGGGGGAGGRRSPEPDGTTLTGQAPATPII